MRFTYACVYTCVHPKGVHVFLCSFILSLLSIFPWYLSPGWLFLLVSGGYWPANPGCGYGGNNDCYPSHCHRNSLKWKGFELSFLKGKINMQGGQGTFLILSMVLSSPLACWVYSEGCLELSNRVRLRNRFHMYWAWVLCSVDIGQTEYRSRGSFSGN